MSRPRKKQGHDLCKCHLLVMPLLDLAEIGKTSYLLIRLTAVLTDPQMKDMLLTGSANRVTAQRALKSQPLDIGTG